MKRKIRIVFFGMCNHPGTFIYILLIGMFGIIASRTDNGQASLLGLFIGVGIGFVLLSPLYIWTAYLVGKANESLIDKENKT